MSCLRIHRFSIVHQGSVLFLPVTIARLFSYSHGTFQALSVFVHVSLLLPIAGNINQSLQVDSVVCNFDNYPYQAKTYARQVILRESNVTERSLVTVCRLVNATRSDDNPNGFTIEGFTIVENRDISTVER